MYCITNCFDFDANKVNEYILYRTQGVGADWQNYPFNEIVEREYRHAYKSLQLESIRKGVKLEFVEFDLAYKRFNTIARRLQHVDGVFFLDHERSMFCTRIDG